MLLYESANLDETKFDRPAPLRRRAPSERTRRVRVRHALLPRSGAGAARAPGHVRAAADAPPRPRARGRLRCAPPPPGQLHQRPRVDAGPVLADGTRCGATHEQPGDRRTVLDRPLHARLGCRRVVLRRRLRVHRHADTTRGCRTRSANRSWRGCESGSNRWRTSAHDVRTTVCEGDTVVTEHVEHWEWPTGETGRACRSCRCRSCATA